VPVFFISSEPVFMRLSMKGLRINYIGMALPIALLFLGCQENTIEPIFFGTLEGTVTFASDSLPAEGVEISTSPATSVVFTDSIGNYTFTEIPTGNYSIIAKLEGFKSGPKNISISKGAVTQADLELQRELPAPPIPILHFPKNGEDSVQRNIKLIWSVANELKDELTYSIVLHEANQETPLLTIQDQEDTTLVVSNLKYSTIYYWQVKVKNTDGAVTNGDLWNFKTLPFPDNRIVFASAREGNFEIYSSDETGDTEARLTFANNAQVFPQYSNDRSLIAFTSFTGLEFQLFTMNKNGENVQQVSTLSVTGYHNPGKGFCWSPDNGKIMYSHYDQLYTIDRNGTNLTLVATAPAGRHFRACDWTEINNRVVVETVGALPYDTEIRLVNLATAQDSTIISNLPGTVQSPSFSVDGTKVLYTYDISGFEISNGRQLDSHIFLYDLVTGLSTDLSGDKPAGTNDLNPRFSPTGAEIIFENAANDNSGVITIWKMSAAGDSRELLFTNASMPDWK
jgi:TolB protein